MIAKHKQSRAACLPKHRRSQTKLDAATCLPVRQANLKELGYGG